MIEIPVEGIATDAAHSTKNKITEFQGIDLRTGKRIFYQNLGNKTVNIGEFLGVVEAAKYIIENDYSPRIIYTDSSKQKNSIQEEMQRTSESRDIS